MLDHTTTNWSGCGYGNGASKRSVKDAEDRGVRANAQRERENRHRRKSRIFSKQTKTKAGVTQEVCHAALSLSGNEDETSPGKGHDSSDYFIPMNPAPTRDAQRQIREQPNPTSTRRFLAQKSDLRATLFASHSGKFRSLPGTPASYFDPIPKSENGFRRANRGAWK